MKSKAIIPLALGLVVGLVAIKYTMDTVQAARGAGTSSDEVTVVMALRDIPSGSPIAPDMLAVAKTPKTPLLPPDAYSKPEDLMERVTLKSIPQGVPILPSMLAPAGSGGGVKVRMKEGYRAVAVKIDESTGVAYLVKPGDWVDVLVVMDVEKRNKRETISRVILQRVEVGAVGQVTNEAPSEESGGPAQTVTLFVKGEDVPKLHLAQTRGRITLAMRGNDDAVLEEAPQTTQSRILGMEEPQEEQTAAAEENKPAGIGDFFSGWFKAAAEQPQAARTPAPPVEQPQPFTVAVINSSATADSSKAIQQVTYRDRESMEILGVHKGQTAPRQPNRAVPTPELIAEEAGETRARHGMDEIQDTTDYSVPTEVNE